ncbi:MAG: PQQ-dependent sugar dehydrogenase [Alphaproteobacteria bacterium]|nr:PQQ-dependent sugar dehydrogenase [Alphaproteobacteria bacterium]
MKHLLATITFVIGIMLVLPASAQETYSSQEHDFKLVPVASGLEYPWGMTFLPNGDALVTEREGQLRMLKDGKLVDEAIKGLPDNIYVAGQGGLLDVALHPEFEENKLVYISYAGKGKGGANTEIARGRLDDMALKDIEVIFKADPKTQGSNHYGSRLAFLPDGTLMASLGDRFSYMHQAQKPSDHLGTIIRINDDGSIPEDNPFVGHESYKPEIYSYGHRNTQGLVVDPSGDRIWQHEHGPKGGDEVNILKAGANYGWPAITYGINYNNEIISEKTHMEGMKQPVIQWTPSIAPCGMDFYTGDKFPEWQGDIFVGALVQTHLRRLKVEGDQITEQEVLLDGYGRFRDVQTGPDGYIYVLIDALDGQVLRLEPL